jgi:hypothetical protein
MNKSTVLSAFVLLALAGSVSNAQSINWASAVDGNWAVASNWDLVNVPNTIGEDAVLGLVDPYLVSMTNSFTIGSLTISNPLAVLELGSSSTVTLNGNLINDGTFSINVPPTIFNTHLFFGVDATISGGGSIFLNAQGDPGDAQIVPNGFMVTHAAGHTIHGSGQISGSMINSGDIIADDPGGAGLRLAGTLTQTASGNAGADSGTMILGNGSVTTGGEFITVNGGVIHNPTGTATIGNILNSGDITIAGNGNTVAINGDVLNNGSITINSTIQVFNGHLRFDNAAILNGTGSVTMISAGSTNDAQIYTSGAFNGEIGANQTVQGAGQVNGATGGTMVNHGTINGNDVGALELTLFGNHSGSGVYRSDNGLLGLGSGLMLDGGTFDSSGSGIVEVTSGGIATLSNVTNLGEMGIRGQGGSITLAGPMVNDGTLTLNSNEMVFNAHLRFGTTTNLTGSGVVQLVSLGDLGDAQLLTNGLFTGTIGANQTVQGSGQVNGANGGAIANNGTINGNHAAVGKDPAIELRLSGNHDGSGGGIYRSDDGVLGLSTGLVLDGGTFDSSGVGIVNMTTGGVATLSNVTNLGEMGIRGQGGSIALTGPMINDGVLTINSDNSVFNAHLRFRATTAITGSGTVRMQILGDLGDAQMLTDGAFDGTIGASQTVAGSGLVLGGSGGTVINNGTINGDDPDFELRLQGSHDGTGGGVYRSDNGVLGVSSGVFLNGGTFDSSGTGSVTMTTNGTAMLSNVTNIGTFGIRGQGGVVGLTGPFTNNGTILINSDASVFNAHIRFFDATEINGTGTIDMFINSDFGDAQILNDQGFVGTIGSGQTITGSGRLQGEMNMNGTLNPGSTFRQLTVDNMHLSSTSAFIADLGGLLPNEFDRLTMGGTDTLDLAGTLTVNLDTGYVPVFGDSWDIVSGGTTTGVFDSVHVPVAPFGQIYRVIYEPSRVYVVLTCDADLTGDNTLDFFDVSAFLNFFSSEDVRGDLNGDGQFNFFDVSLFLSLFTGGCDG